MFEPIEKPRVFGVQLGCDFSTALHDGLRKRFANLAPEDVAQVEVYVNTRRMQRRLIDLFHEGDAVLLPRIRLVTDLGHDVGLKDIPPAVAPLRRRLEVAQLVKGLIEADPTLAARDSAFDLADSLVALMGEMQGEGVPPEVIEGLDITDQSGHWQRALSFIQLVQKYFGDAAQPDGEGRQRRVIEAQIARWVSDPPKHPVIVAGSTGSRGATSLFMQSVAMLPQGAVILPGVDMDMPASVWDQLDPLNGGEDHPQYRFKAFCDAVGLPVADIARWAEGPLDRQDRTALVSLSLRPAPVTDQWITDGPRLGNLHAATKDIALIEAATPREEADAIAVRLREAVEQGQTAALITPDRMLTRQVTAALDRWDIKPDDSAGQPLQLSAPGRFLRHVADLFCDELDAERLLVLLRHPLTHSQDKEGSKHSLNTNALELELRRYGPPFPTRDSLTAWASAKADRFPERVDWAVWVAYTLVGLRDTKPRSLDDWIKAHLTVAEALAAGVDGEESGELWLKAAGREAKRVMSEIEVHAEAGGTMTAHDYRQLVGSVLSGGEVRDRDAGHPQVLIWGTLEARVQSADLVILGGMNEGSWPEAPAPDPWLNRPLRVEAGLLLPERRIGLSAHDYQQAICARHVVISRSIRSDEAETVPSRWVNRLMNLLGGLEAQGGPECLTSMRDRGQAWLQLARLIAAPDPTKPVTPARRPSPAPPADVRPRKLSVTQIQTLIRDPYAIYARKILGLNRLDPLTHGADAPLRGTIVHKVLERFVKDKIDPSDAGAAQALMTIADDVLQERCPWPAVRTLWRARIAAFVPYFLDEEIKRRAYSANIDTEMVGELTFPRIGFTLVGTADRIDLDDDGEALIYDYKTGPPPSPKKQKSFDKQLLLEAAMVERGAFKALGVVRTKAAIYIGLGGEPKNQAAPLEDEPAHVTLEKFEALIAKWMDTAKGYTSRRATEKLTFEGDYDHLARFGEWDITDDAEPEMLK